MERQKSTFIYILQTNRYIKYLLICDHLSVWQMFSADVSISVHVKWYLHIFETYSRTYNVRED